MVTRVNFWWYKRAMCLECTAHYKNSYPEVWMSADQHGIKEEILPMFITTITMKSDRSQQYVQTLYGNKQNSVQGSYNENQSKRKMVESVKQPTKHQ